MGLLGFLFGHKQKSFTPVSDDWPPEGSVQFVCREPHPSEHLPVNFLHYEFGPNWNESDPVAIDLGLKILRTLCQDKRILVDVCSSEGFYYRPPKKKVETFSEYCFRILGKERPDTPARLKTSHHLVYLNDGYDEGLQAFTEQYFALYRLGTSFFVKYYVLAKENQEPDMRTALERVEAFRYDMKLEYIEYGPTSLEININTDTVDVAFVQAVVEKICRENQVLLLNPPE